MKRGWPTLRQPAAAFPTTRRRNNNNSHRLKKSQKVRNQSKSIAFHRR